MSKTSSRIFLSSPTTHGEEQEFVKEASISEVVKEPDDEVKRCPDNYSFEVGV